MESIIKETTLKLELTNSIIHGIGILFGIASIPLLTALAIHTNNIHSVVGASVYGFCFLMLFTFSTLYHGFQQPRVKQVLQVFDHISIYFLIAGTYTPFILNYLYNTTGIIMLCVLWSLVLLGIVFKIFFVNRFNILSTIIYLLMGWMMVWGGKAFFVSVPFFVIVLIIIGGVLYSVGVVFYLMEKWKWHHVVWHLFVLAAAICHYVAVLLTVV
ncbi:hemolysin-III related [mine drainage metagenome]|uniref:Hemolysin-III related n=1 Tax=mine drainage metagenome TaxID=410659 RepID=A0A1J5TMA7_9ZZZZ